jgi:hypothetical protein
MKGRRIDERTCEQIKVFAVAGMRQKDIATKLGLCRASVCHVQRKLGLGKNNMEPLPTKMVDRIRTLLRAGRGEPHITRVLNVPRHRVRQVMHQGLFRQKAGHLGCRYQVSREEQSAIRTQFRAFEKTLANEYNVSLGWVQRFLRRRK